MSARRVAINTLAVVAVLCAFYVLYQIRLILLILLLAILLSVAIEPFVFGLRRMGAKRTHSVLLIYLVIALTIGVAIVLGQHVILTQIETLIRSYPKLVDQWISYAKTIKNEFIRSAVMTQLQFLKQSESPMEALGLEVKDLARYAVFSVAGVITVFVICFYWISEKPLLRGLMLTWASDEKKELITNTWNNVETKLGGWVRGQILLCGMIGGGSFVGFSVMGVRYAFLLAVWAGITEIIPVVGPYIGIIPAVMIAMLDSFWLGVGVAVYGLALQFIENNFLVPRIMSKTVGLTPLTVMISLMVGATLFGVAGALVAVPVAAAVSALLEDIVAFKNHKKSAEVADLIQKAED